MQKADFMAAVRELGLKPDSYIVTGSGVLCALGIREAEDIDLVVSEPVFRGFEKTGE